MSATDSFHAHLDTCPQCEKHPFDLCAIGAALIQRAASEVEVTPADNAFFRGFKESRRISETEP